MSYLPLKRLFRENFHPVQQEDPENIFELDIDSWCHGLMRFGGELSAKLLHALIREMSGSFLYAVKNNYAFSVVKVAKRIHKISKGIVNEKELALHIIACLPNPSSLESQELSVVEDIIRQTENIYPDVALKFQSRLQKAKANQTKT